MAYAHALVAWGDVGGYDYETLWDVCTVAALGMPFDKAQWRKVTTLSGGEQKRVVLEALLRGPEEVLLLDEPDNYLDVPAKRWLEDQLIASPKTVLFVSHDRELLNRVATRVATLEPGGAGLDAVGPPGPVRDLPPGPRGPELAPRGAAPALGRGAPEDQGPGRRCSRSKAKYNDGMAPALPRRPDPAAQVRGGRAPAGDAAAAERQHAAQGRPHRQARRHRRGSRARPGLMKPFDLEIWFGERVAVLGSNGSGKSHFLRLVARGGSDPDAEHRPVGDIQPAPVTHTGRLRLGSRVRPGLVRPDPRAAGPARPHPAGDPAPGRRAPHRTTPRGGGPGAGPLRPGPGRASRPSTRSRVASRRGSRSCCSSCPGRPACCSTSRPTTSTCTRPRRSRRGSRPSRGPSSR